MAHMLRREGFDIVETGDAAEALSLWRDGGIRAAGVRPRPARHGRAGADPHAARRGRPARTRPRTSVIVCSGSPVPVDEHWDRDTDFDAYIVKPVELGTLTETLRRLGVGASTTGLSGPRAASRSRAAGDSTRLWTEPAARRLTVRVKSFYLVHIGVVTAGLSHPEVSGGPRPRRTPSRALRRERPAASSHGPAPAREDPCTSTTPPPRPR